jgi:hypothetical protein
LPAATTIVLGKADRIDGDALGRIGSDSLRYGAHREVLDIGMKDDFVRFHTL